MKRKTITAILMGMSLIIMQQGALFSVQASSGDITQKSTVRASVPDKHNITIERDAHATVTYEDSQDEGEGDIFPVDRFSTPTFAIETEEGWIIDQVLLDGVDVTDQVNNKKITLPSVYQNQTLKVTTKIKPEYTVMIPQSTTVSFNKLTENYGKIEVQKAWLEDGKCIQVSMDSDRNLENEKDATKVISYQILEEGQSTPFIKKSYTKEKEGTSLTINIKQDDWNQAASGAYSDTVTFTISYVDSE